MKIQVVEITSFNNEDTEDVAYKSSSNEVEMTSIKRFYKPEELPEGKNNDPRKVTEKLTYKEGTEFAVSENGNTFVNQLSIINKSDDITSLIDQPVKGRTWEQNTKTEDPNKEDGFAYNGYYKKSNVVTYDKSGLNNIPRRINDFVLYGEGTINKTDISANEISPLSPEISTGEDFFNQLGKQIGTSFSNIAENYNRSYKEVTNLFKKDFWLGEGEFGENKKVTQAFGKLQNKKEEAEKNITSLDNQITAFSTKTLNTSVNVLGNASYSLRGPLGQTGYFTHITAEKDASKWARFGVGAANAGIDAANQFINSLGLNDIADIANGVIKGAANVSEDSGLKEGASEFIKGYLDSSPSGTLSASEVIELNSANATNIYTSKPGTYIKYGSSKLEEFAAIVNGTSKHPTGGSSFSDDTWGRSSLYQRKNIGEIRAKGLNQKLNYQYLYSLMTRNKNLGIPFFEDSSSFEYDSIKDQWVDKSLGVDQVPFGVFGGEIESATIIQKIKSKNTSFKELGRIYIKYNPTLNLEGTNTNEPLEIPFEFTPIITENANTAKYASESLLGRIGAWHMYTGTDLGGITLTTTYMPLAPDSQDEIEGDKKNKQLGVDTWQYYWTQNQINQIELLYRSLVFPSSTQTSLIKPPVIQIELGKKGLTSLDNFFKHPIAVGITKNEDGEEISNNYLSYTKVFNNETDRYKKSYIVTSCQISPIDENGYYNMYGSFRTKYSNINSIGTRNRSFEAVADEETDEGKALLYGVTTRGFKVSLQCMEIKENLLDIYPDFKCYYDSVLKTQKYTLNETAKNAASATLAQAESLGNMGMSLLTENAQPALHNFLDNIIKKMKSKAEIENTIDKVVTINKIFYNDEKDNYADFGATRLEKDLGDISENAKLSFGDEPYIIYPLTGPSNNDYCSIKEYANGFNKNVIESIKNENKDYIFKPVGITGNDEITIIPNDDNKFFSAIKEDSQALVRGLVEINTNKGSGDSCYIAKASKNFENLKKELANCQTTIATYLRSAEGKAETKMENNYDNYINFINCLGYILYENDSFDKATFDYANMKKFPNYTPKKIKNKETGKLEISQDDKINNAINDFESELEGIVNGTCSSISDLRGKLESIKNLTGTNSVLSDFSIKGAKTYFKGIDRRQGAVNVLEAAFEASQNNLKVLNKQSEKFQSISVSVNGDVNSSISNKNTITVSFRKKFKPENNGNTFETTYTIPLKITIKNYKEIVATVETMGNEVNSTYEDLITSTKSNLIKMMKDSEIQVVLQKYNNSLISQINNLSQRSDLVMFDSVLKSFQKFWNIDKHNRDIVNALGGQADAIKFCDQATSPNWSNGVYTESSILQQYSFNAEFNPGLQKYVVVGASGSPGEASKKEATADHWETAKKKIEDQCVNCTTKPEIYSYIEKIYGQTHEEEQFNSLQGLNNANQIDTTEEGEK